MYSETVETYLKKAHRRGVVRRWRQGVLLLILLVVAIWRWLTYRADHHTSAWDRRICIGVAALLDDDGETADNAEWLSNGSWRRLAGHATTFAKSRSGFNKSTLDTRAT